MEQQYSSGDGIMLQTCQWGVGPTYTFPNTSAVQGTLAINMGFNSLKCVLFCFLPLDYQRYSFCRKQFRICHNITKFYLTLGQDQIPLNGVSGHAGYVHPTVTSKYQTNKNFLINLYKAFNKLHDTRGNCLINQENFAVNQRPYDPTFRGPLVSMVKGADVVAAAQNQQPTNLGNLAEPYAADINHQTLFVTNPHTAAGLPLFHETRVIGKALFGLDTETMSNDYTVLSGLNTVDARPFNLTLEVDSTNSDGFERESQIYIFFYHDVVIQLRKGSTPIVSGRQ